MDILSVVGSAASIVGLSIQIYDKFSTGASAKDTQYLALFLMTSDLTSSWKKAHHKYHSNFRALDLLRRSLIEETGSTLSISRIAPDLLREKFRNSAAATTFPTFERDIDYALRKVKGSLVSNSSELKQALSDVSKVSRRLADALSDIRHNEDEFFRRNASVVKYINIVAPALRLQAWNQSTIKPIVTGFENFYDDQNSCIMLADEILLTSISIFDEFAEEFSRSK